MSYLSGYTKTAFLLPKIRQSNFVYLREITPMKLKIKKRIRNNSNVKRLELAVEHKLF
jgi:hypothetical protein